MLSVKQLKAMYPTGSFGGQCVIFCRKILKDLPYGLNSKADKRRILMQTGQVVNKTSLHKVGDMIVTNQGDWGHVAIINEKIGRFKVKVSESNYKLDEKINHDRLIDLKNTKIEYFWRSRHFSGFIDKAMENQIISNIFGVKGSYELATKLKDHEWHEPMSIFAESCRKILKSRGVDISKY